MSALKTAYGIFLALLLAISSAKDVFANLGEIKKEYLTELREIDVLISVTPGKECRIEENTVRAEVINRTVPAGIKISKDAFIWISVAIATVDTRTGCASSLRVALKSLASVQSFNNIHHVIPISLNEAGGVYISPRDQYESYIKESLRNFLDELLADWREANAGADFVRQAPHATPSALAGPNIRTVQERLQALRFYQGAVDGVFGPGTRQAIQGFQRSQQLPATGDMDLETMRRLFP